MYYPKFKYHKTLDAIVVNSADEEASLSEGWADSPAAFGVITAPSADQLTQETIELAKAQADEAAAFEAQSKSKKSKS